MKTQAPERKKLDHQTRWDKLKQHLKDKDKQLDLSMLQAVLKPGSHAMMDLVVAKTAARAILLQILESMEELEQGIFRVDPDSYVQPSPPKEDY